MVRRSTWIILGIFAVLLAIALILPRIKGDKDEEQTPTETAVVVESLFDVANLVVLEINFSGPENQSLTLRRDTTVGDWTVAGFPPEATDVLSSGVVAGQLFALRIQSRLDNIPPLSQMGLIMPDYMITMIQENGDLIVLRIGDATPTGSGYYVQVDDEDPVVVGKVNIDSILVILENPPLLPTATPEVTETPDLTTTPEAASTGAVTPEAEAPEQTPESTATLEPTPTSTSGSN